VIGEKPTFERAANGSLHQTNLKEGSSLYISATGKTGERDMLAAIDAGRRSIREGKATTIQRARSLIARWAAKSS